MAIIAVQLSRCRLWLPEPFIAAKQNSMAVGRSDNDHRQAARPIHSWGLDSTHFHHGPLSDLDSNSSPSNLLRVALWLEDPLVQAGLMVLAGGRRRVEVVLRTTATWR